MTKEQLKQNAAAMIAFADGKPVQFRRFDSRSREWAEGTNLGWNFEQCEYRPKPEPVTRPWSKPEDVPGPVCWIRSNKGGPAMLIDCVFENGVAFTDAANRMTAYWGIDFKHREHSTDRKTWHPCTVVEP